MTLVEVKRKNETVDAVSGKDADRAVVTLRSMASRPPAKTSVTRATVDDMLWAIRQINDRNALIADALRSNDTASLAEGDVQSLEQSYEAIRAIYEWVAASSTPIAEVPPRQPRSLSTIAAERNITLRALRHLNPELDHLRADDLIPSDQRVKVPPRSTSGRDDSDVDRPRRATSQQRTKVVTERRVVRVAAAPRSRRTIHAIADEHGVTTEELRDANPGEYSDLSDNDVLPEGSNVRIVVRRRVQERQRSQSARDFEYDDESEGDGFNSDGGRRPREVLVDRGAYRSQQGDTLRRIASEVFKITLPRLRVANPELNRIGDYWELAIGTTVYREPPLMAYDDEEAPARRESDFESDWSEEDGAGGHMSGVGFTVTQPGDTVALIARQLRVRPSSLVVWNPDLRGISPRDPLPKGMRLKVRQTVAA